MTRHLVLSVRFLDDRYHGLTDNGEKAEWPPSPFRVFQALVAGNARGTEIPLVVKEALCWLERLEPPLIVAPSAQDGRPLLTYVLNNVSDTNPNSRTPKMLRPTLLNGDRLVQYAWVFDDNHSDALEHARTIADAARHIRCLGWGIDLAIGSGETVNGPPVAVPPRVQYRPTQSPSAGGLRLRSPVQGSLVSLERNYADFLQRYAVPGVTRLEAGSVYEPWGYVTGAFRPNVAFRLVNTDEDPVSIPHQLISPLVGMVRDLANRDHVVGCLGRDTVDREIMGHPKESSPRRVSILPLPTVRAGPTDGRIRRLMLAQPFDSDGDLCRVLGQLLDEEELRPLPGETRLPRILLQRIESKDKVLHFYSGVSRVWASVTPVLLPGYDDRKQHRGDHEKRLARAEQLALKALGQAGVTTPARFELSRVPFWTGSLHAQDYSPREKLRNYPRHHMRIEFETEVTGPLAIGAGRHAGFGLMAAVTQTETQETRP